MYLNDSETNSFPDNIRKLLSIHGGCWITADFEVMPEHNRILSAIHPGESSHDTSRILKEKADVGAEHNKLMVRYGNENEDMLAKYEEQRESEDIRKVRIDCHSLDYISSAGLRVLLIMQKGCKEGVSLTGANEVVSDILIQGGFSDSLDIDESYH